MSSRRAGWLVALLGVLVLSLIAPASALSVVNHDRAPKYKDIDARVGKLAPTSTQLQMVKNLGARAEWNRFGTPRSLIKYGGLLASGLTGTPATAARTWIRNNRALFRLTDAEVTALQLVYDAPLVRSTGRVVLFRQRHGTLGASPGGLIAVGINRGRVFYASSSAAGGQGTPASALLSPTDAWIKAAQSVGRTVSTVHISNVRQEQGWTVFRVSGFITPMRTGLKAHGWVDQRAQLVAVQTPSGARAAYRTLLIDNQPGRETGYETFVDARTGAILMRYDRVVNLMAPDAGGVNATPRAGTFTGTTPATGQCGPLHPFTVDQQNRTISGIASGTPVDDVVLNLRDYNGTLVASADTLFSPEPLVHELPGGTANTGGPATADWAWQVCEFADVNPGFTYTGAWNTQDVARPQVAPFPPAWRYFQSNPPLGDTTPPYNYGDADTRLSACFSNTVGPGARPGLTPACDYGLLPAGAAHPPWDHMVQANTPSFSTLGNNAITADTWLTPQPMGIGVVGPSQQRPIDFDRSYGYADAHQTPREETFTNSWNTSLCNPAGFATLQGHDLMAAVVNLHAAHNRHHDWTYHLGFTEPVGNAQVNNLGRSGAELDPEIGNAQAGALVHPSTGVQGRNNANQFIVPDGVPGITNQYLWQPIPGSYPPCADGNFDMIIVGHEYGHLVNHRMVAGPASNMSGHHSGAMSESWGDQNGLEYVHEYDAVPVGSENPWAMAVYATGDHEVAIRNYPLNASPLQFGDMDYDPFNPGTTGHSNGEIWSAANFDVREALRVKYDGAYPSSDTTLQRECADGVRPPELCPGNRRWIQLQYDSYLLMANPDVTMLQARDAMIAADFNRAMSPTATPWPSNQTELWRTFASNGFGCSAVNADENDHQPKPAYDTPVAPPANLSCGSANDGTITFRVIAADQGTPGNRPNVPANIFISHYEARVTPIADTGSDDPATTTVVEFPLDTVEKFTPGTYPVHVVASGYGHMRGTLTVTAGQVGTHTFHLMRNWASKANGADATAVFPATKTAANNEDNLLDDTEETQWDTGTLPANVNIQKPDVIIDLGGTTARMVRAAKISGIVEAGRTSALRRFELQACNEDLLPGIQCNLPTSYTTLYTSGPNDDGSGNTNLGCVIGPPCPETRVSFPAHAFRPIAPDMLWRAFDIPLNREMMATHVRLVALDNQCTGEPRFQGDHDLDPISPNTDCDTSATTRNVLRMSEIEIFEFDAATPPPGDPAVVLTKTGPATATQGSTIDYTIKYKNAGPLAASSAKLTDTLPASVSFVSASNGGTYNAATRTVTWSLGTVGVNVEGARTLRVRVNSTVPDGTAILNQAQFTAPNTVALPAAWLTLVT